MTARQSTIGWKAPRGFALVYGLVLLAIVAIVATLTVPVLFGTQQTARVNASLVELRAIEKGVCGSPTTCLTTSFSTVISFNIGAVSQLSKPILNSGTANSCGLAFGKKSGDSWLASPNAPFVSFWIDSLGFELPIGTMVSAIIPRSGTKGDNNIFLQINNVDTSDANLMDLFGDTTTGATKGQITWPTTGNPVTVKYRINLLTGAC